MENNLKYIIKNHKDYPERLDFKNIYYTKYKKLRNIYFHNILQTDKAPDWSETLVPSIDDFKDKFSYITNDYILNSIYFEYCNYFINGINNSVMLPVNPYSPTGLGGRGLLGKWGPNHAADPIVITYDNENNIYELLVIERVDTPGIWALPGGMRDKNEYIGKTLTRELKEETNLILDSSNAILVYSGYVNDPRNTDHAWIETCAFLFLLTNYQRTTLLKTIKAGDDAASVKLIKLSEDNPDYINLYANHKNFVENALLYINN